MIGVAIYALAAVVVLLFVVVALTVCLWNVAGRVLAIERVHAEAAVVLAELASNIRKLNESKADKRRRRAKETP